MIYIVEAFKQPVHMTVKKNLLKTFEQWFIVLLSEELPPYFGILSLYLLIDCKFYDHMLELSLVIGIENNVSRILRLFLSLAYEMIDREAIPSLDHLFYSMKYKTLDEKIFHQQDHEEMYYISKIENILKNNTQILSDYSYNSENIMR